MYAAATVEFTQERYNGTEDAGILQVGVEMIGGTVSIPVDITVTLSEQSSPSAQGNQVQWRSYSGAQWGTGPTISLCGPTISKSIYHVTQFHSKVFYA